MNGIFLATLPLVRLTTAPSKFGWEGEQHEFLGSLKECIHEWDKSGMSSVDDRSWSYENALWAIVPFDLLVQSRPFYSRMHLWRLLSHVWSAKRRVITNEPVARWSIYAPLLGNLAGWLEHDKERCFCFVYGPHWPRVTVSLTKYRVILAAEGLTGKKHLAFNITAVCPRPIIRLSHSIPPYSQLSTRVMTVPLSTNWGLDQ